MATTRASADKSRENGADVPSAEEIEKRFEQLRSDIAALTDSVQRMGAGKMHEAQNKAADAGHDLTEAYEGALDNIRGEFHHLEKDVTNTVRANPLQAVGIAAGIGFLLAMLTRK